MNNKAFTLIEVLVSAIIFVVTIGGLFVTLNAVRTPVASKENGLAAAVFGKQVLETLRGQVNASTYYNTPCTLGTPCTDFSLGLGPHNIDQATLALAGLTWPAALSPPTDTQNGNPPVLSYTVSCADGTGYAAPCNPSTVAHQVTLNIKL